MYGELIPCGGGDSIALLRPELVIGRHSQADIRLQFPNVSTQHCQLRIVDGFWYIRDLGSRNGIRINEVAEQAAWVYPDDIVSIANHKFQVVYEPFSDRSPDAVGEDPFELSLLEKAGLTRTGAEYRIPS